MLTYRDARASRNEGKKSLHDAEFSQLTLGLVVEFGRARSQAG